MNTLTMVFVCITLAVSAMGDIDRGKMMEIGKKCKDETGASDEEVKNLMNRETPTTQPAKCMMACIFKTLGVLDGAGMFDGDANLKLAEESFKDKPEKIEKTKAFIAACKDRINTVADDAKACERAVELHVCGMEKAKEFGYEADD